MWVIHIYSLSVPSVLCVRQSPQCPPESNLEFCKMILCQNIGCRAVHWIQFTVTALLCINKHRSELFLEISNALLCFGELHNCACSSQLEYAAHWNIHWHYIALLYLWEMSDAILYCWSHLDPKCWAELGLRWQWHRLPICFNFWFDKSKSETNKNKRTLIVRRAGLSRLTWRHRYETRCHFLYFSNPSVLVENCTFEMIPK